MAIGVGRPLDFEGGTTNPLMAASLESFKFNPSGHSIGEQAHRMATVQNVLASYSGGTLQTEAKSALEQGLLLADRVQKAFEDYEDPITGSQFGPLYPTNSPGRLASLSQVRHST